MTLGERIEQLRVDQGISLNELARRSTLSSGHVSNLERDNRCHHASIWTVVRVAQGLDVSIDELMNGVEEQ